MAVVESLRSKALYKLTLIFLKIIPVILAACNIIHTALCLLGIDKFADILSMFGSCSLLTLIFLYLTSFVFRFCEYHRMPLHYIVVTDIIDIIDYYIGIPINTFQFIVLEATIMGIAILLTIYLYVKSNKTAIAKDSR